MSAAPAWTAEDVPDLTGTRALVTGVTSGIGEKTALELARHGAEVVLAARSQEKLARIDDELQRTLGGRASLRQVVVDLADLSSVRRAARTVNEIGAVDLLINNAGVMATPWQQTVDGFELQRATNHLGPFAFTGLVLPALIASGGARVVSVSSMGHWAVRRPQLTDPRQHQRYRRYWSYAQSKAANLMFVYELDRRCRERDLPVTATAAHPGFAGTALLGTGRPGRVGRVMQKVFESLGQPPELGALPTLLAATGDLPGGSYVGPSGPLQLYGHPVLVGSSRVSRDRELQRRLWEVSEQATGVTYP